MINQIYRLNYDTQKTIVFFRKQGIEIYRCLFVLVGESPQTLEHLQNAAELREGFRYFFPRPFLGNMLLYTVEYFSTSAVKN